MQRGYFMTGTDTNIGKTWATVALMRRWRRQGLTVAGMKPVAAGCQWQDGGYKNQDALLIQAETRPIMDYSQVNPYAFAAPISPHLACGDIDVDLHKLAAMASHLQDQAERIVVEGAGGWLSPISQKYANADLAIALQLPVVLVVGVKLGCLNHARLSYQAIKLSGVVCAGWVAVQIDPEMAEFAANLTFLTQQLATPLLAVLPHSPTADFDYLASRFIEI